MKKLLKYSTIAVLGLALLTGCKKSDHTPTALFSAGKNTTAGTASQSTLTREVYASGLSGKINEVKVRFIGSSTFTSDVELYLKSPSGKILQLCGDESMNANNSTYPEIDVTFTDAASVAVADWRSTSTTSFTGTFKPRGSLLAGYAFTGTTTTLGGYKGDSPNGTWTLYVSDDAAGDITYFTSWELFLSTVN